MHEQIYTIPAKHELALPSRLSMGEISRHGTACRPAPVPSDPLLQSDHGRPLLLQKAVVLLFHLAGHVRLPFECLQGVGVAIAAQVVSNGLVSENTKNKNRLVKP